MVGTKLSGTRNLAHLLLQLLRDHRVLEVKGLGEFHSTEKGDLCFGAERRPVVFISYVSEDRRTADRIAASLVEAGFSTWVDRRKLQAGDAWQRSIESAIASADYFVACLSRHSVRKRGFFQKELRMALDVARTMPLDDTYFLPLRLNDCTVPRAIRGEYQYMDLFPDLEAGMRKVVATLGTQWARRAA